MHLACLNPQGNFDPADSYWSQHPDFGGQLVYVKELALALARLGHRVDVLTRRILDPAWPEFAAALDAYPGVRGVRIVRLPCGPPEFLPKEALWPHLGTSWLSHIVAFYEAEGAWPQAFLAHYADGGLVGALLQAGRRIPFTFTAHSLGAQKLDKLGAARAHLAALDERFHFARRLAAERVAMSHAARIITSTRQERFEQYGHRAYRGAVDVHDETRFALVPPGVNRTIFHPRPGDPLEDEVAARIAAARARDLPPERRHLPLVLCSARLAPKKNHRGLVLAFASSDELRARANLALVVRGLEDPLRRQEGLSDGERAVLAELVALIEQEGLRDAVTAFPLNGQAELAAAYRLGAQRGWVFALVSLHEPFGLAPLEAMACGLPVVVTCHGGPRESLRDETTGQAYGVLVDPTDPAAIAAGLLRLLGSQETWTTFQRAGLERVQSRYTWEQTARGYLAALRGARPPERLREPLRPYFTDPRPEHDLTLAQLAAWYFAEEDDDERR